MKYQDCGRPVPRADRREAALCRADRRHRATDEQPDPAGRHALGGKGRARAGRQGRGLRPEVRGDRERADPFLPQGDAGPAGPRRADRELPGRRSATSARAGMPVLGFHFMPNSVWRTERAGARAAAAPARRKFDMAVVEANDRRSELLRDSCRRRSAAHRRCRCSARTDRSITEEQMWANYDYFIKAVLPVAEEEGVKLALHPDDPPVPMLGGVARIFTEPAGFKRAYELAGSSDAWGLDLCLGCCSEMPGGKANVTRDDRVLRAQGRASSTSTSATCKGTVPELHGVLHRRGQLRSRRGHGAAGQERLRRLPARRPRPAHGRRHRLEPPRPRPRHRLHAGADPHGRVSEGWLSPSNPGSPAAICRSQPGRFMDQRLGVAPVRFHHCVRASRRTTGCI